MRIHLVLILFFVTNFLSAQVERPIRTPATLTSAPQSGDSIKLPVDSIRQQKKGDIETAINYTAKDSIVSSLDGKLVWLYGEAKIVYGAIEITAEEILIDYGRNTLIAHGKRDSLGRRFGYPVFKNGSETYETKDIEYNFKTKRAKISEVVTQQGDGIIHGQTVYKNENDELLTRNNLYTTCNLEHPHFAIRSSKVKAIKDDKIVSGPFHMEFNGVPIHAMGLPFGMFPAERESKSGIIFPSYGEERRRGFNIRNGGYFFDISEYLKITLLGDLYTKGGRAVRSIINYNKRYAYTGSFNFSYTKNPRSENIEDRSYSNDYSINWSHSPQTKGTGRFSASVSAATSNYNTNNNLFSNNVEATSSQLSNTTRSMNSNISFSKTLKGTPFSFGLNATHWQDLLTKEVRLTLPTFTVNMNNIYPFQKSGGGKTGPLQNLNFRYTMASQNKVTNKLDDDTFAEFSLDNFGTFWDNGIRGMKHSIPISTSAKILKYFTLSPSMSYDEVWYGERILWGYNDAGTLAKIDTSKVFNRVATYSGSVSLNTRIYGTVFFKRGNVKAIRHVINPSVSYGYKPDFSSNPEYFQKFVNLEDSNKVIYKSRHDGFMYGGANLGRNQTMSFSLGNNLEMKVKSKDDTVARKVMLLNQFSLSSGYNFLADSFNLSNISMSANTNLLNNKLNVNASAVLDPYRYVNNRRVNEFKWANGEGIGRITTANIAMSTNLNPKGQKSDAASQQKIATSNLNQADKDYYLSNPNNYIDFSIPWNLRLNYSLSYSYALQRNTVINPETNQPVTNYFFDNVIKQTLQFSGDLSLSEQWKIKFNSGFDFEAMKITQTTVNIARDLHCWTMLLDWTPFGYFTQYNFTIRVKSSVLQDLKMERRKPFFDNN